MSMITEQIEYLIKLSNKHPFDSNIPTLQRACKEAANIIEQLVAKVRADNRKSMFSYLDGVADCMKEDAKELEAYQKAFEDIRAELDGYDDTDLMKVKYVRQFIDKHNPDKVGK